MGEVHANAYLSGNFAPVRSEDDFSLTVQGEIPQSLRGTLYRNGPNPQFAPRDGAYHWFTGDGMLHAFSIGQGGVTYRNRWVRTARWTAENVAGRSLFGLWGSPMDSDFSVIGTDSGVANTNIVHHAGRLMALEEAHAPFEVDARSLASRGPMEFGGRMTAHPKIDPVTGEMIFFAYADDMVPLSPRISWGVVSADGILVKRESFKAPYCAMIHDFMVTAAHILIPVLPLTGDLQRAMAGKPIFAWEPQKPAMVGVMRRDQGVASLRWYQTDACYVFHVMNAYEADGALIADVMRYDSAPLFPGVDGASTPQSAAHLTRWRFDLSGGTDRIAESALDDLSGEFPRFDERYAGLPYRHGWIVSQSRPGPDALADRIAHIDVVTGARSIFTMPDGDAISEPVFVADSDDAAEGAGFLLAVAYRAREDVSDLLILRAQDVAAGPIASARMPRRVPFGFHGNWVGAPHSGALAEPALRQAV